MSGNATNAENSNQANPYGRGGPDRVNERPARREQQ